MRCFIMKKTFSLLLLLVVAVLFGTVACNSSKTESATPDSASKDEIMQMNNLAANLWFVGIAKIDNKLYYADYDSFGKQTLYDVTTGSAEKLYEENSSSIKSFDFTYMIDGNMLLSTESRAFAVFDPQNLEITDLEDIYSPTPLHKNALLDDEWCQYIIGDVRYFADTEHFYRYQNGEYELVLSADATKGEHFFFNDQGYFCVYGSELYYLHSKKTGVYLCRYEMNTKELLNEALISDNPDISPCFSLIADREDVYYTDTQGALYHINLVDKRIEEIFRAEGKDPMLSVNYHNSNLYIGSITTGENENDGLYKVCTDKNNMPKKLVSGKILAVYIVDEDDIYYVLLPDESDLTVETLHKLSLADNSTEEILRIE